MAVPTVYSYYLESSMNLDLFNCEYDVIDIYFQSTFDNDLWNVAARPESISRRPHCDYKPASESGSSSSASSLCSASRSAL